MICGQRNCGKTTLAKYLLKNIQRRAIYDINAEYREFPESFVPQSPADQAWFFADCYAKGNITVCVDEADLVFSKHKPLEGAFYKIVHLGRHRNVGLITITRRVANLHTDVFALADHIFIFRLFSPPDIDYLKKFIGDNAYAVQTLPNWHFCYYDHRQFLRCPPLELTKNSD